MSSQGSAFSPAVVAVSWTSQSYSVRLVSNGFGYSSGDVLNLKGTLFGGTSPLNDLTLVPTISQTGVIVTLSILADSVAPSGTGSISLCFDNVGNKQIRDASDVTRRTKELLIYVDKQSNFPDRNIGLAQSNQYRLSYLHGKIKCGACGTGALNLNGALYRS